MYKNHCSICGSNNVNLLVDLGYQPLANDLTDSIDSAIKCSRFDLSLLICNDCLYVWLREQVPPNVLFSNNTYLTGVSSQTMEDMKNFAEDCLCTCNLSKDSTVLDIASNDGTLLSFFKKYGCHVLGIDPSRPAYEIATANGVDTINQMFDSDTMELIMTKRGKMDLITATNIITHVPDPKLFLMNCKYLLKSKGSLVVEFYNFESMISNSAFDQIYHEHISYFNFTTFSKLLNKVGLEAYKVEQVHSQGGSLRVFISFTGQRNLDDSVKNTLDKEGGLESIKSRYYLFPQKIAKIKTDTLELLKQEILNGNKILGYGASAKATVMLNFLHLSSYEIIAIADKSNIKQGKFIPGAAIPIISPDELKNLNPDVIIIFAWNLKREITNFLKQIFPQNMGILTINPEISLTNTSKEV
jgi:SAM-dependent methyltransferase